VYTVESTQLQQSKLQVCDNKTDNFRQPVVIGACLKQAAETSMNFTDFNKQLNIG
jgi:hypothetical protein